MGCSCDWQRTRFTLDEVCARAVRETFFTLFKEGKIYRGKRLVNWDTFLQTAVSDDEVFHETVQGHFWHFKYPVVPDTRKPGEPTHVDDCHHAARNHARRYGRGRASRSGRRARNRRKTNFASGWPTPRPRRSRTFRPRSTRSSAAGAKCCRNWKSSATWPSRGVMLELPLTGRQIPLIADQWAKPELGSGCVKITPAHDPNDYDVWQRHLEIGASTSSIPTAR